MKRYVHFHDPGCFGKLLREQNKHHGWRKEGGRKSVWSDQIADWGSNWERMGEVMGVPQEKGRRIVKKKRNGTRERSIFSSTQKTLKIPSGKKRNNSEGKLSRPRKRKGNIRIWSRSVLHQNHRPMKWKALLHALIVCRRNYPYYSRRVSVRRFLPALLVVGYEKQYAFTPMWRRREAHLSWSPQLFAHVTLRVTTTVSLPYYMVLHETLPNGFWRVMFMKKKYFAELDKLRGA